MAKIIGLPKLSPTMEEGTLVAWAKQTKAMTSRSTISWRRSKPTRRPWSFGRSTKRRASEDSWFRRARPWRPDVPVAIIGKAGEDITDLLAQVESAASASAPKAESETAPEPSPLAPRVCASASGPRAGSPRPCQRSASTNGSRVLSSPLVRRLARERSIDLADGPRVRTAGADHQAGHRILRGSGGRPMRASGFRRPRAAGARPVKASSMRRTIARRLTESKQSDPSLLSDDRRGHRSAFAMRARRMNAELEKPKASKVSLNDLIIKAAATALRRVPEGQRLLDGQRDPLSSGGRHLRGGCHR